MPFDANGFWYPDLFAKQLEVFNCNARALLVCGPRLSGKTHATLHRVVRHLWETPNARVAMFSRTMKNSKDGGTWALLEENILKQWINAKIGLEYTTKTNSGKKGSKIDGQTRTPYFKVSNSHGGESELKLFSLDYDNDAEDKLKEMEFSQIYFSELSKFRSRKILSMARLCLRMGHLGYDQQQFIADTNPSEEGEASWIYQNWYLYKNMTYPEYVDYNKKRHLPILEDRLFYQFQQDLELVEIPLEANTRLDPRQVDEVKTENSHDPGMWARHVLGKWIYGDGDSSIHFRGIWKPATHVVGDCTSPDQNEWVKANPHPRTVELIGGFDLGDVNHAAALIDGVMQNNRAHFTIIDELVSIGEDVSNETFTEGYMALVEDLDAMVGVPYLIRAWSDSSSIEKYSATGDTYPYLQVELASKGRVSLRRGPKKSPDSVRMRVQLLKQLLHQGRIRVSAHCKFTIRMFEELKKGSSVLNYVVSDENKHIFDAITYALMMECYEELAMGPATNVGVRTSPLMIQV